MVFHIQQVFLLLIRLFLLCILIPLWNLSSQCIPLDQDRSSSLSIWYTTQHVSQRLLSCSWDLNSNFTAWARHINVESPAALKIDKSLNRNVVAYETVIAPSKHCITPGFAVVSKLHCAPSVLPASSLSLPLCYKKSIGFQIAEEHIWLILNGYSSCTRPRSSDTDLWHMASLWSELILLRTLSMPPDGLDFFYVSKKTEIR